MLSRTDHISSAIQTRCNTSAPGINMIPYKVYKKCPQLMSFLFKLCLSCQRNQVIPIYWTIAHEAYIPKNKHPNPSSIEDFRPISLMNIDGKLFFSLVSQRFVSHIIKNLLFFIRCLFITKLQYLFSLLRTGYIMSLYLSLKMRYDILSIV